MMVTFVRNGRRYVAFARLAREAGLIHAFSTRPHDVAMRTDARAPERAARRRRMAADLGLAPQALHCCIQVHQTRIARVEHARPGRDLDGFDGAITAAPGAALMTFSADCPLLLVFDPVRRAVGMAHASWRCTVAGMAGELVEAMRAHFGSVPADLLAGIGPSAGPERYEVQDDVYQAAATLPDRAACFLTRDGRMYFNLWEANRQQLCAAGLAERNVEIAGICTITDSERFYSFRREGPGCGHFGLMAGLRASSVFDSW